MLKLTPLHANGAVGHSSELARMRYSYQVANVGTPDLKTIQTRLELQPIVQALAAGKAELARKRAGQVTGGEASVIAQALTDSTEPTTSPAEYKGRENVQNLTNFKVDAANVGWRSPTYNRVPEDSVLLESAGEIFATGIYAHADARHEYALGGKWETLQGQVGIATGHSGSVRFEIRGDGRQLWGSPTVRAGEIVSFQVSLQGIQQLELITSQTVDGKTNDWGLWLEPKLLRTPE